MSELHTYRVEWSEGFGMPHEVADVKAFTAPDAVAQKSLGGCRVHRVEPIPDATPALHSAHVAALVEALEWCGGSSDFAPGGKARDGWLRIVQPLLEPLPDAPEQPGRQPRDGELVAIDGRVFSVRLVPLSGATTPRPTIAEIERALNTPTAPENVQAPEGLRPKAATVPTGLLDAPEPSEFQRQNVELHAAIFGHAFGSVTHEQAVAEARRLRAEAQTLKWERDHAIASATAATRASSQGPAGVNPTPLENIARAITPEDRIEALEAELQARTTERDRARKTLEEVRDAGSRASSAAFRAGEERDRLRSERDDARAWSKRLEASIGQWRDTLNEIAAIVWPHKTPKAAKEYALAELVEAARKMGAERDALCAQVERQIIALRDGQRDKADLRDNIQAVGKECDALQKRIDAAKAWSTKRCVEVDRVELVAILEGREP